MYKICPHLYCYIEGGEEGEEEEEEEEEEE